MVVVILQTKTPTYAASVVRVSKRYFRYQSGKGFLFSTGTLFAPNYDIRSISAAGTSVGSLITIGTDEIDHGLQPGAKVRLEGIETSGYEGTYTVDSIVDDYVYKVAATQTLGATDPVLKRVSTMYVTEWRGAAVRSRACLMMLTEFSMSLMVNKYMLVNVPQLNRSLVH